MLLGSYIHWSCEMSNLHTLPPAVFPSMPKGAVFCLLFLVHNYVWWGSLFWYAYHPSHLPPGASCMLLMLPLSPLPSANCWSSEIGFISTSQFTWFVKSQFMTLLPISQPLLLFVKSSLHTLAEHLLYRA